MSHEQARNMVSTLWSFWMIAWVIWIWYWLFTKEENGSRKFSFPSLWKLWAVIGIPMLLNYTSQATTWNWILDNLARLWKTWEFPWSSSESLSTTEAVASQQAMWQFVLLWIPKRFIKKYWTFDSGKMTKINVDWLVEYFEEIEKKPDWLSSEERARAWAQRIALQRISKDDAAKIALNNYVARLWITKSSLDADPDWTLNERLWEAAGKYEKLLSYTESRWLIIASDKKDKVVDALFKEKKLDDKVFDKLMEEWCFAPNPDDYRFKEIAKLNISNEKKFKFSEAYEKIKKESTKYGNISLKVEGWKVKLTSWDNKEILLNPDLTIDGFTYSDRESKVKLKDEEELLRVWLLVNTLRSTDRDESVWKETPVAKDWDETKWPFAISSWIKIWWDIEFRKHNGEKVVISSCIPFFSEMASKYPTIEVASNREFFVKYLNKLWIQDHPVTTK
jgi:hypothetical protein